MSILSDIHARVKSQLSSSSTLALELGGFCEFFSDDAILASKLLNLELTKRKGIPMCGYPKHKSVAVAKKLSKAGLILAICKL